MWRRRMNRPDCGEPDEVRSAREAAEHAERERRHIEAKEPQTKRTSQTLRDALDRNHFGESIERALSRRGAAR